MKTLSVKLQMLFTMHQLIKMTVNFDLLYVITFYYCKVESIVKGQNRWICLFYVINYKMHHRSLINKG